MCGRFGVKFSVKELTNVYKLSKTPKFDIKPRYNVAPSQLILGITKNSPLVATEMLWGFVPSWSNPKTSKFKPINARDDKLTGGFYRVDFSTHRCIIPASFFYEWKRVKVDGQEVKQPYLIKVRDTEIFSLAGLYAEHKDAEGKVHKLAAIITTKPNSLMKKIHDRMPVIIDHNDVSQYLEGDSKDAINLIKPFNSEKMESWRVSDEVNSPRNDNVDLIKKLK